MKLLKSVSFWTSLLVGLVLSALIVFGLNKLKNNNRKETNLNQQTIEEVNNAIGANAIEITDEMTVSLADTIKFNGYYYGSVGHSYTANFDKKEFSCDSIINVSQREPGLCGGDEGTITFLLIPKKKGTFSVCINKTYRGTIEESTNYKIKVK